MSIEVRPVQTSHERKQAIALRRRVFVEEQGVPENDELDGRDDDGLHLVGVDGDQVIATCRLVFAGTTVQLSRLAVEPGHRRDGIASRLLDAAEAETRAGGARRIVLHAQTYARELYDAKGYRPRGPTFVEAGIEHVAMERALG